MDSRPETRELTRAGGGLGNHGFTEEPALASITRAFRTMAENRMGRWSEATKAGGAVFLTPCF